MFVSTAKLEYPSVSRLWNIGQSRSSGMSVSPATLEFLSVPKVENILNVSADVQLAALALGIVRRMTYSKY